MINRLFGIWCLAAAVLAQSATCQSVLEPAAPQPRKLMPGLEVRYAYPEDVKTLEAAQFALEDSAEPGKPLSGLDYRDRGANARALTSRRVTVVAAKISGMIRFDEVGEYTLRFFTNDGLDAAIGGVGVAHEGARTPCQQVGGEDPQDQRVLVPEPGWYPLQILWFQRYSSSCLYMEWKPPAAGTWQAVPRRAFGHVETVADQLADHR
ncbi:MAG: hypothetical protein ACWA5A_01385 [Marinibacterium sp.]